MVDVDVNDDPTPVVFCVEHYNPLGIVRSLGEYGIRPRVIVVKDAAPPLVSRSRYVKELVKVDSIEEGYELLLTLRHANASGKRVPVLTADDRITSFLDQHYDELIPYFAFFNAGEAGRVTKYQNKNELSMLAVKHGLNVLKYEIVKNGELPTGLRYPVITKDIASTIGAWKDDVYICNSETELKEAFEKIEGDRILVQEYLEKENEYCLEGVCTSSGNRVLIAIASKYNYLLPDSYSPYMTVSNFDDEELGKTIKTILREIGFEGIFEAEFLVGKNGSLYFGEINFRNSTWSYAATKAGMPLPVIWIKAVNDEQFDIEGCKKLISSPFRAVVEPNDFMQRILNGHGGIFAWLKDLMSSSCHYYLNVHDMKPVFCYLSGRFSKLWRRSE